MQVTIVHEEIPVAAGLGKVTHTRYRVNFTTEFSDQERAWLFSAGAFETVLYRDPPVTVPGFKEPLQQRLTVGHLVKRRPNRRTFATWVDAQLFEQVLRANILPQLETVVQASRWMSWSRRGEGAGPTDEASRSVVSQLRELSTCSPSVSLGN